MPEGRAGPKRISRQPSYGEGLRSSGLDEAIKLASAPEGRHGLEGWPGKRFIRHRRNADVAPPEPVGRRRSGGQRANVVIRRAAIS